VAEEDETGMTRLIGAVTPNVVPPGTTGEVTFHLPAGMGGWWIFVNPGPHTGALLGPNDIPRAAVIHIGTGGQLSWSSR